MSTRLLPVISSAVVMALSGQILPAAESEGAFKPAAHPVERYQHIWEKSPFVTEAPVIQESGGLAQRFALTGVASLQNQPMVFVLDRQSLSRLVVTSVRNQQGLELVSVEGQGDPKQSTAIIRLGTEQAVIRYDLAALQSVNPSPENPSPAAAPQPVEAAVPQTRTTNSPPRALRVIRRSKPINLTK